MTESVYTVKLPHAHALGTETNVREVIAHHLAQQFLARCLHEFTHVFTDESEDPCHCTAATVYFCTSLGFQGAVRLNVPSNFDISGTLWHLATSSKYATPLPAKESSDIARLAHFSPSAAQRKPICPAPLRGFKHLC